MSRSDLKNKSEYKSINVKSEFIPKIYDGNVHLNKQKRYARSFLLSHDEKVNIHLSLSKGTYELLKNKNHVVLGENLSNITGVALTNDTKNQIIKKVGV